MLDLDYGKTENGTNIQIYQDTNSDAQQFKFVKASDNSYVIYTKSSIERSSVHLDVIMVLISKGFCLLYRQGFSFVVQLSD